MSVATRKQYPSLAEIVREETDNGRRIVQFYLGVADGSLEGFRDHHRMSAANRLGKIAPKLVAQYLQKYYNNQCRDSYRGTLVLPVRRSPIAKNPPDRGEPVPRGPNRFQRRLTQLVRQETGDGRTIFTFLDGVMHGTFVGFKPHHRLEAAKELASYLDPSVIPAEAGTHPRPRLQKPAPAQSLPRTRYGAGTHPLPTKKPKARKFPPITVEELAQANFDSRHIARCRFARDEITGAIYAFDHAGPFIVDDEGVPQRISPSRIAGYGRAARRYHHRTRSGRSARTRDRRRKNPNAPIKEAGTKETSTR